MKTGAELITDERNRQITYEGYTSPHDDAHHNGELRDAAICYIEGSPQTQPPFSVPRTWPWSAHSWKPSPDDRIRDLVKAGALIAAEIDRVQRRKNCQSQ